MPYLISYSGLWAYDGNKETLLKIVESYQNTSPDAAVPNSDLSKVEGFFEANKEHPNYAIYLLVKSLKSTQEGKFQEAAEWVERGISGISFEKAPIAYVAALIQQANVDNNLGNRENAIKVYEKAAELALQAKSNRLVTSCYLKLAEIYYGNGNLSASMRYAKLAIVRSKTMKNTRFLSASLNLAGESISGFR